MTTPDERRRNLIWGRETLEELAHDDELQAALREEAVALLAGYPLPAFMQEFDASDVTALHDYATVLYSTRLLFLRVGTDTGCSEQRRYQLRVVLRHFG